MEITQELVALMICPACQAQVQLRPDGSALQCVACRRVYAIKDGIPDMLVEHATIEDEQPKPAS
ncbi:MAG TPA: Trm112 family protein [Pyrinomonadaceae bacterium]